MSRYQASHKPVKRYLDPMTTLPIVLVLGMFLSLI